MGGNFTGGDLNIGVVGTGVLTIGKGSTLSVFDNLTVGKHGRVINLGVSDPQTITVQSGAPYDIGVQSFANIDVLNDGTLNANVSGSLLTPLLTHGSTGNGTGLVFINSGVDLVLNTNTVDAGQTVSFADATGTLELGQAVVAGLPGHAPTIAPNAPNVLAGFAAPIQNYQSGDAIVLRGLSYGSATASGDVVTVWSGAAGTGTALGSLTFLDKKGNDTGVTVVAEALAASVQLTAAAVACFAEGTRIGTPDGAVRVETLRVGDLVLTADGAAEPMVWVGSRAVDCARHPSAGDGVAGAGSRGRVRRNVPVRDLYLSPDHAVFVNGVLVPVKLLVNGTSITQVKRKTVTYYHVELPEHDVILAEGLTLESYLDTGDRADFAGQPTVRPHANFSAGLREGKACAPLIVTGPILAAVRGRLRQRAAAGAKPGGPRTRAKAA